MSAKVTMRIAKPVFVLSCLMLGACGLPAQQAVNLPFHADDFKPAMQPGNSSISGQALVKDDKGNVKSCANFNAVLIPDNAYTENMTEIIRTHTNPVPDPDYYKYRRAVKCDAQGRFAFENLPAGRWIVEADTHWSQIEDGDKVEHVSFLDETATTTGDNKVDINFKDSDAIRSE